MNPNSRRRAKRSRLILAAAAAAAAAVILILAFISKDAMVEKYHFYMASSTKGSQKRWHVEALIEMGSGTAVPFILDREETHLIEPPDGLILSRIDARVRKIVDLGPDAVPYLVRAIRERGPAVRDALLALEKFGPAASPAVPALIEILRETRDRPTQYLDETIDVLTAIGGAAHVAVDDLVYFLDTDRELQRWTIYRALERIGPKASDAIPRLLRALGEEDGERLVRAARALERIAPGREEVVPALIRSLRDDRRYAREDAAGFLGELGPRAGAAIPTLLELARNDPEKDVALAAARAISRIDPGAAGDEVREAIRRCTQSESSSSP